MEHCARCTGGIYTVWRTSANKKYYHPHCFTCAICNVVLENTQECGIPTLKEIYCRECFRSYFSDNGRRTNRSCSISEEIEYEILKQHAHSLRHREQEQSPEQCAQIERVHEDHDKDLSEGSSDTSNKAALQKPPHNNNSRHTYMKSTSDLNYEKMVKPYGVERKVSRIPRPTSATSKKCLTSNPTKTCVSVKKLTNATTECPRSPIAKMGRSVSLVQPCTQQRTNHSNLLLLSFDASPKFASPSTTPTKRQCAASFSTSNNALRNVELQRNPVQIKPSLARAERSMKSGIPSTQDILSVIRRESSDLINFKNLNLINRPGYGSDVASALPRNIYNITFDCPICIGSLVHSGDRIRYLKARFDEMIAENEEFSFKAAIASSLQSASIWNCRNRLQLQWENKN
ncbi:Cysteine and glycine-rich protein 3 [Orchesella cincta]|uniref:Cysteine and glycine-rich protein 3 n=1 Tax=Orchesella cincta TaxID=48709 RepID=A0A1D2M321_ORCCI|nr:Cysteine and glycine-rich protein 3 [Orchesella cincta]